jgi:exonuclease SbcD
VKLLCTGDLHIGRRPSQTPSFLDGGRCSCAAAWEALVECAIKEGVDAVLISGDVVDRSNRFYEAFGPLERGLRRLAQAGIDTFAVAGNHDFDVLPRLVDTVGAQRFHLLGRGGVWEKGFLRRNGRVVLEVHGWSFPTEYVDYSPLQGYHLERDGTVPVLGLLHADIEQPTSRYAPVSVAELQRVPLDFWHLGHIHSPRFYDRNGSIYLYPGCPQAMDPGETGWHGAWLLHLEGYSVVRRVRLPLSAVRYEGIDVDFEGVDGENEVETRLIQELKTHLAQIRKDDGPRLECVCFRLRVIGRTRLHRRLPEICTPLLEETPDIREGQVRAYVEKLLYDTRPAYDLEDLARGNDPPGVLARLLLALNAETLDEQYVPLLQKAQHSMRKVHTQKEYASLGADEESSIEEAARKQLLRQGYRLLDALLAQKEQP